MVAATTAPGPDVEPPTLVSVHTAGHTLVSADSAEPDAHVEVARKVPSAATMLGPNATSTVEIDRAVTLVIEHATDRATYRRDVVIFSPGVSDGEIGVPCRSPAANDLTWPDPSNTC